MHEPCAHNFVRGLQKRTLGYTFDPATLDLRPFKRAVKLITAVVRGRVGTIEPVDLGVVVEHYRGVSRLYRRYTAAKESLEQDGPAQVRDARVKAFVKGEKLALNKVAKPRVIMARDPRYNLELASYLFPVERALYPHFRGWGNKFYTHTRLIGKGLGPGPRAELIREKFSARPDMVAMEIDGASFESHFSLGVLQAEHGFYQSLCPSRRLAQLLSWQLEFHGRGHGVEYRASGVRASGDYNTGLGNTLVMCALVLTVAKKLNTKFDFLADGDNALLFLAAGDLSAWVEAIGPICKLSGFKMTLEKPVRQLEEVVFGQSKPLHLPSGWTMVRNPLKVLSHAAAGYQHYAQLAGGLRVLKAVAYCEAVLSAGVPILSTFAHTMLRKLRGVRFSSAEITDYEYRAILARGVAWEKARLQPVAFETRLGFEKSWGIGVEEQLAAEVVLGDFELPDKWDPVLRDLETHDVDQALSLVFC